MGCLQGLQHRRSRRQSHRTRKTERLDQRLDDLQVVEQTARRRWPQLDEKTTLHNHTIDKAYA